MEKVTFSPFGGPLEIFTTFCVVFLMYGNQMVVEWLDTETGTDASPDINRVDRQDFSQWVILD